MKGSSQHPSTQSGQALVELLFSLPVMVMLLLAVFLLGVLFYTGQRGIGAVRQPLTDRIKLADTPSVISASVLSGLMNAKANGSLNMSVGSPVDTVNYTAANGQVIAYLKASKAAQSGVGFFPAVNLTMVQGIDASLLSGMTGPSTLAAGATLSELPYPDPAAYGFDGNNYIWNNALIQIDPACSPTSSLTLPMLTQATGGAYTLTAMPAPSTTASIGAPQLAQMYVDPTVLTGLGNLDNAACDTQASLDAWLNECQAEFPPPTAPTQPVAPPPLPSTIAPAPAPAPGPAPSQTYAELQTAYQTVLSQFDQGLATEAQVQAAYQAMQAGYQAASQTYATNLTSYQQDVATQAQAATACQTAKQKGCRIGYANQYISQQVQAMQTQCNGVTNGSQVQFKPAASYRYD